jgi:tetraacyldisaccharide 4'-kinase
LRRLGKEEELPLQALSGVAVVAFAGIGNPSQFLTTLKQAGIEIIQSFSFADHHNYRAPDCQRLVRECERLDAEALITTEKDAEKLSAAEFGLREVFAAKLAFEFNDRHQLSRLLSGVAGVAAR